MGPYFPQVQIYLEVSELGKSLSVEGLVFAAAIGESRMKRNVLFARRSFFASVRTVNETRSIDRSGLGMS